MSGLSRWQEFCFADSAKPSHALQCLKKQGAANRSPRGRKRSLLVDGFLEALPRGEGGDGLGANLDLLAAGGAAPGPRLSFSRQKCAEADYGDALAARDVGDDRFEHRVERVARRRLAEIAGRSEEHTSELQSQSNLVCRLLLEKTKYTP